MKSKSRGRSYRRENPRDVLARLIAEHKDVVTGLIAKHPKAGKRELKDKFLTVIRGKNGRDALDSVADYWFEANWEKLKGPQP